MSELAEWLERYRRGAELVATVTTGAAGTELDFHPGDGKWSVRQIVCHLADLEVITAMRFRQIIAEENPAMPGLEQDAWAEKLDYSRRKMSQALETFRRLRAENHELLKGLPEETFARKGTHAKRGVVSLQDLLRIGAEHAEKHTRQIQATRAAYREHKAQMAAAEK